MRRLRAPQKPGLMPRRPRARAQPAQPLGGQTRTTVMLSSANRRLMTARRVVLQHRRVSRLEPTAAEELREERPGDEHQDDAQDQAADADEDGGLDAGERFRVV